MSTIRFGNTNDIPKGGNRYIEVHRNPSPGNIVSILIKFPERYPETIDLTEEDVMVLKAQLSNILSDLKYQRLKEIKY